MSQTSATAELSPGGPRGAPWGAFRGYENRMVAVTSLMVAFVAFDRLAIGYLAPYLVKAFGLSNTDIGALYAAQAGAAAVGGYVAGFVSDRTGWRKQIVVPFLVLMAAFSLLSGFATGFVMLLMARVFAGAAEGPIAAVTQSIVSMQSSPHRRGLNMGVVTLCMFLVSQMASPILLTRLADQWGWSAGLLAPALPALLLALAAAVVLRRQEPQAAVPVDAVERPDGNSKQGASRNVWICAGISMIFMCWLVIHSTFLPLYLVQVRGMSPLQMGLLLSVLGVAGCVGGLVYPALSDRIGRRPTMVIAMVCATITPLGVLFIHDSGALLAVALFLGWLSVGALPIYSVVIPGESAPPARAATTIAMVMGCGELVGGVAGPLAAGRLADTLGLVTPFWFTAGAVLICAALSLLLKDND
ncbi:MAG TPA: MFS transporter [Phenylobacterium sp.]